MKKLLIITLSLFIFIPIKISALEINSNNAVLYNLNDNEILLDKNKDQKVSIASLTKLMTALVAIENIENINEKVTFVKSDYEKLLEQDASGSSLDKNKEYTYEDLLYGLILESGADCANALARLTAGNEENFVKLMNEKAKQLNLTNTSFAGPIGLDNKNNYSSMKDVATLLKEVLKNEYLKKIVTSKEHKLTDGQVITHTIYWYMKNARTTMPYLKGGKTGYETDSGYALASVAEKEGTTLMLITTKADKSTGQIEDAKNIYEYYFNNYSYQTIINKNDLLLTLNTKYLNKENIKILANNDIKIYTEKNYNKNDIKIIYEGIKTITPKNKYKSQIGTLNIYYKNNLLKQEPILLTQKLYPDIRLIIIAIETYLLIIVTTFTIIKRKKMLEKI